MSEAGEAAVIKEQPVASEQEPRKDPYTFLGFSSNPDGYTFRTDKVVERTHGMTSKQLDPERAAFIESKIDALRAAKEHGATEEDIRLLEEDLRQTRRSDLGPNASRLRDAAKKEVKFQGGDIVHAVRDSQLEMQRLAEDAYMSGAPTDVTAILDEETEERQTDFETAVNNYTKKMMGKGGISEVKVNEETNEVTFVYRSVPYYTYQTFGNPEDSADSKKMSRALGTAMIVRTTEPDGKTGKIIVQHRSTKNKLYGGIPGASVAGLFDAGINARDQKIKESRTQLAEAVYVAQDAHRSGATADVTDNLDKQADKALREFWKSLDMPVREKGKPDSIDSTSLDRNITKETNEELALSEDDLAKKRPVAVVADNIKEHDEVVYLVDSHLSFEQIKDKAKDANRNRKLGPMDFEEKFVAIDATPQAIETLLTKVHCPLPPTHAAAFLAAGYSMILNDQSIQEEQRLTKANEWKDRVDAAMKQNYKVIDEKVNRFNGSKGYNPELLPEAQGLPNFDQEMEKYDLVA